MPLANGFLKKNQFKNEFFYKMEVGFNKNLSLFQINEHPKPKKCLIRIILFIQEVQKL